MSDTRPNHQHVCFLSVYLLPPSSPGFIDSDSNPDLDLDDFHRYRNRDRFRFFVDLRRHPTPRSHRFDWLTTGERGYIRSSLKRKFGEVVTRDWLIPIG
jgi:hypothetical protein